MFASYMKYFEKPFMCATRVGTENVFECHTVFTDALFEVFQHGSTLISSFLLTLAELIGWVDTK